jgi:hypothetical protein
MCIKVTRCVTLFTNNVGRSPPYLSIPLFMTRDCVQKYGLIHMEDAVKTVTKVGFKKRHFELPLKQTVFGGLFCARLCRDFVVGACVMELPECQRNETSGSKETPPPPALPIPLQSDSAQQLPSPVFFTDLCMWTRHCVGLNSGLEKISLSARLDLPCT